MTRLLYMLGLGLLVFCTSAVIDYAHARYAAARDQGRVAGAVIWSLLQWGATTVGFVVAVTISLWMLPFEAAGLALGTYLAVRYPSDPSPKADL
jgi:hypothetical protein